MKQTEIREVTQRKEVVVSITCDACGSTTPASLGGGNYWSFFARHYGRGNDSDDSITEYDYCSARCYFSLIKEALKEFKDDILYGAEIDKKPYVLVEQMIEELERNKGN